MARTYLEFQTVNHHFETLGYENLMRELEAKGATADMELLKKYPESFAKLYDIRESTQAEENMVFEMRETDLERPEIVTEAKDVEDKTKRLELACQTEDGLKFTLMAEPYDKPGEDNPQLKMRLNFADETLEKLNDEKFKRILEFCERHGISVYSIDLPEAGNEFSLDEKLADLTKKFLENRREEDLNTPEDVHIIQSEIEDVDVRSGIDIKKKKGPKTLQAVYADMVKFLEKDIHKTAGLTYFEHMKDGMVEFSLYDKPNRDNEKLDGQKDKNGVYVPTYSYRLYIGQNEKTGNFQFGYATPGGKKMDDVMAGDFMGVIKDSGATHLDFRNIPNQDKGVWLVACAEKGIVPIGISLNIAKMNMMREKARVKLGQEEFIRFEKRLAAQYRENAEVKGKTLESSEESMLSGLEEMYKFENLRKGYSNIYLTFIDKIEEGAKDRDYGAATTIGAGKALTTLFEIYKKMPDLESFVSQNPNLKEAVMSTGISLKKSKLDLAPQEWEKLYDALIPAHIEKAKVEIQSELKREEGRKYRRNPLIVIDGIVKDVKGSLSSFNAYLQENGVDKLALPTDYKNPACDAYIIPEKKKEDEVKTPPLPDKGRDGR